MCSTLVNVNVIYGKRLHIWIDSDAMNDCELVLSVSRTDFFFKNLIPFAVFLSSQHSSEVSTEMYRLQMRLDAQWQRINNNQISPTAPMVMFCFNR